MLSCILQCHRKLTTKWGSESDFSPQEQRNLVFILEPLPFRAKTLLKLISLSGIPALKLPSKWKWEPHFVQYNRLNVLLVSVKAWSCVASRAVLGVWRTEVWLPTWESVHTEMITKLFFKFLFRRSASSLQLMWYTGMHLVVTPPQRKARAENQPQWSAELWGFPVQWKTWKMLVR